jgi:predicted nucleic acid-binding protein
MRVYLDTPPIVYMVEQNPAFSPAVATKLTALGGDLVSSELARMEALVVPVRNSNSGLIRDFEDFFGGRLAELLGLTRPVFDRAVRIRAAYPFKTPDALHLAAAAEAGCDAFLTNDQRLTRFPDIRVEVI